MSHKSHFGQGIGGKPLRRVVLRLEDHMSASCELDPNPVAAPGVRASTVKTNLQRISDPQHRTDVFSHVKYPRTPISMTIDIWEHERRRIPNLDAITDRH